MRSGFALAICGSNSRAWFDDAKHAFKAQALSHAACDVALPNGLTCCRMAFGGMHRARDAGQVLCASGNIHNLCNNMQNHAARLAAWIAILSAELSNVRYKIDIISRKNCTISKIYHARHHLERAMQGVV